MRLKFIAKISLVIMISSLVLCGGGAVRADSSPALSVSNYDILMNLNSDGSAEVTETLSFLVGQSQNSFDFSIDYAAAGSITFGGIGVASQTAKPADAVFVDVPLAESANSPNLPTAYRIQDNGRALTISLQVLSGDSSSRMVRISYQLARPVVRHTDAALIKRDFFTTGGPIDISQPSLTIQLPEPVSDLQTWCLPVSTADFRQTKPQPDQLRLESDQLLAGQTMSLYCLLPADIFPTAASAAEPLSRSRLIDLARQAESEQHQRFDLLQTIHALIYILLAFALVTGFLIYWFYDRESGASFRDRLNWEIPPGVPPARMSLLMRQNNPGRLILATLMDLVRRGVLHLRGCVFSQPEGADPAQAGLAAFEIFLLEWFFGRLATNRTLSTADIRRLARDPETSGEFTAYFQTFHGLLNEDYAKTGLIDSSRVRRGRGLCLGVAALYLVLAISSVFLTQNAIGLILLLPTVVFIIYSRVLRRLSVQGRELYARVQALRRTIREDFPTAQPDPAFFQRALPLAIGLGSDRELFRQTMQMAAADPANDIPLANYGLNAENGSRLEQIKLLAADLKVMESMLSASLLIAVGTHF